MLVLIDENPAKRCITINVYLLCHNYCENV